MSFIPIEEATAADQKRFWVKVTRGESGSCWIWKSTLTKDGYGRFWFRGRKVRAHRFSYTMANGSVPDGMVLDHLCRTRSCVRPDHLRPVTNRENLFAEGSNAPAARRTLPSCMRGHAFVPSIADRIVQAAREAIVNETGEPTRTAVGPMVEGRPDDLAGVAAEAAIRMLAECAWFDPNVLHLTPADLYELVRQIEQQGGRE